MDSTLNAHSRPERSKSPIEQINPGRRARSSRAKKEGGRSAQKGTEEGGREALKLSKTNRGRSKERKDNSKQSPHTNGNSKDDIKHYSGGGIVHKKSNEMYQALANNSTSISTAGRKATVSPGPWKIPGSDKLPSTLRSGTSTLSR